MTNKSNFLELLYGDYAKNLINMRVLDFGCGQGNSVIELYKEGIDTYGVDILPEQVKKAKISLAKKKY